MAVQTITYGNKQYLNQNANIPATNKVQDTDMNEIKSVVNNNATETSNNTTNIGNLSNLATENKTSIVNSINELKNAEVYSTNEVKTNKVWIDGKPIYRKVIESNFTTSTGNTINYATSSLNLNMETLVGLRSVSQSNPKQENYFETSNDQIRSYFDNTNLTVKIGGSYPTKPCTVYTIIEYTKTTD